jgi:glycosyltransferase involved in cell wall biosynthesis
MYDAINKGIKMAGGEVIGILNSDDYYASSDVLSQVVHAMQQKQVDCIIGDIVFIDAENPDKVTRTYRADHWKPSKFVWGFMPPHPSVFLKKSCYNRYGLYKTDYQIAADYELLIRMLKVHQVPFHYLPFTMVNMRPGGKSTKNWKSNVVLNREIRRGCRENGLYTNYAMIYSKYWRKLLELKR